MKRHIRLFIQNRSAISALVGELLMTVIVVLAFGIISVYLLSFHEPPQTLYTDIDGWADEDTNTIYIRHCGGDTVNTEDLIIILNVNGTKCTLSSDNVTAILGSSVWQLSNIIAINTSGRCGIEINEGDYVDASIINTGLATTMKSGIILDGEIPESTVPSIPHEEEKGLVSLWYFDENNGSTVYDSIDGNDGEINGANRTTGINGSALRFDGNDHVCIPDNASLNPEDEITVEAWVQWSIDPSSGDDWANIVNKGNDDQYQLQHSSDKTKFEFAVKTDSGRTYIQSSTQPNKGVWYYVVGTYNATEKEIALFINGEKEKFGYHDGSINPTNKNVILAKRSYNDRYFNGIIDEVAIWNRALTSEEIHEHYIATRPQKEGNMVSQWHLDENSGSIAYDSVDNNNGTITGASWDTGVNNSALYFDGIDDYINCGSNNNLDITDEITMEAWAKAVEHKTAKIVQKGDWDGHGIDLDKWNGWKCGVYINGDEKHKLEWGEGRVTLDQWYHVVMTYNGSALELYVDGEKKSSEPVNGSLKINSRNLCIGSDNGDQKFFNGSIDEISIYNIALTSEEIQQRYEATRPREPGMVSLWHLNENSGYDAYDLITSNNGTIHNANWTTGINGSALSFDGNDHVCIPNDASLNPDEVTVEAWVKWSIDPSSGSQWANIVNKGNDNQYQLQHDKFNTKFEFAVRTDTGRSYTQSITSPQQDKWYYVAGTYNATDNEIAIYVNGTKENSRSRTGLINPTDNDVMLAKCNSNDRYFNGVIDEVAIWNKALTTREILEHFNNQLT